MASEHHVLSYQNRLAADAHATTAGRAGEAVPASVYGRLLRPFLQMMGDPPVAMRLWTGETVYTSRSDPVGTVSIGDARTLARVLMRPELAFGEAYVNGRLQVEGDLTEVLQAVYGTPATSFGHWLLRRAPRPRRNSRRGSRQNIHQHYDLGNEFYRLWLDERMVYTCAYFPSPTMSLEGAQVAKMEHVCRKVALRPGEQVVEAGCGWGSLALYMAQQHGVRVRAFNISHEQIVYAREQARRHGLSDRVEFVEDDYRNISGQCDAFVSVGMLEHIGHKHYRELGRIIDRCLPAHGRGLIHSIGRNQPGRFNAWMQRYIFPGAHAPTLREMMDVLEPYDLSVLDVENLRLHYAATLRHWRDRFERSADAIARRFDERFVRAWRLYLCASIAAFTSSVFQLYQVTFARARHDAMPWTRAHLYIDAPR